MQLAILMNRGGAQRSKLLRLEMSDEARCLAGLMFNHVFIRLRLSFLLGLRDAAPVSLNFGGL